MMLKTNSGVSGVNDMDMLSYVMGQRSGGGGGNSGGYDLVLSLDGSDSSAVPALVKGDYSDLVAKIDANELITGVLNIYNGGFYTEIWPISAYEYFSNDHRVQVVACNLGSSETLAILIQSGNTVVWAD